MDPGKRSKTILRPKCQLSRTRVGLDRQFLVGMVGVVANGLGAGVDLVERAVEGGAVRLGAELAPSRTTELPLPRGDLENVGFIGHGRMIASGGPRFARRPWGR